MSYFMEPMNNLRKPTHYRVFMKFEANNGWRVIFFEENCINQIGRTLVFAFPDKIMDLYERCGERTTEDTLLLEHAIIQGRGAIWLKLTPEQYSKLKG